MQKKILTRQRYHEQGQTMILVAISLVSLLAMAALAIDIVTLYAARSEIQRAADAAALAGAKAVADSSITTLDLADANFVIVKPWAQNVANTQINAVLQNNLVAGATPTLVSSPVDWTRQGNPQITVSLQRTNLPTFFSKIWGGRATSVTATATAEAYNPANVQNFTPIAPKGVKPWLVANADPTQNVVRAPAFIDPATGAVERGVIGKSFNLTADCRDRPRDSCTLRHPPQATYDPENPHVDYVPAQITANANDVCPSPSSCAENDTYPEYQGSVQCHDVNPYPCGGPNNNTTWDNTVNPGKMDGPSAMGAECLINAASGQDLLQNPGPWPAAPFQIKAQSGPQNGNLVTTSSSIVTIPIIDPKTFQRDSALGVTVVGFMQAFINQVQDGSDNTTAGDINITVLNIAGCSATPNAAPAVVGGSGTSPVPVRLITPP
jgi:Flp pilus assembly protein TadG